jgi:predicted O-linked N-acetylglucosamine transferase (SPINDLY family)
MSNIDQAIEAAMQAFLRGNLRDAELHCRQAIARDPRNARAIHLLGVIAYQADQPAQAAQIINRAVQLDPQNPSYRNNLGLALFALGQWDQSIEQYAAALRLNPSLADAHFNLANVFAHTNRLDEAVESYRRAIQLQPANAMALSNLGGALVRQGAVGEAIECFRKAIASAPDNVIVHDNLIYMMHFHPDFDALSIREELRRWNQQFAAPLRSQLRPHANSKEPDRTLRIGYVSADWREHCQALFTLPLLAHHDRDRFHVTCYSTVTAPDQVTAKIREHAGDWRDIAGMSDDQAAEQVRADRIDILVDLTLHMADNRLLLFARRPAPVQVTWLGYPGSTGLDTVDYRLTDPSLDPPDPARDEWYTEESVRLRDSFWCYSPIPGAPAVAPLPAQASGGAITFGCLNNFNKISQPVLSLWAEVLCAVPTSRLLLLTTPGSHRQRTLDTLRGMGVDPQRIEFTPGRVPREYLELYHRVDISLDTFPANGHTTSMDSLYMGVPVITLPGQTAISRGGLSILSTIGLPEWVANDRSEFVRIASELSGDLPRLAHLRATLRQRMETSPLMDAPRFARSIETALRQMWRRHCAKSEP